MSVGVALSPLPVAAVVILLMTARARANAPAFLCGWVLGIVAVATVVFLVPGIAAGSEQPGVAAGGWRIVLGGAFLLMAWRQWRRRPTPGSPQSSPHSSPVLAMLDRIGPLRSLGTGFGFSGINPKNLLLVVAGAQAIAAAAPGPGERAGALLVFAALASVTVAAPIVAHAFLHERVDKPLERFRAWLIANNAVVVATVLTLFGVLMVVRGARVLLWHVAVRL